MWIERTIYVTAYKLPGILRWFEVKSVFMVRSVWLYWDYLKNGGFYTARGHFCVSVTVLSAVNKESMALYLAHAGGTCWGCWLLTEGDSGNAFPFPREGNAASPPRPSALLESICVSQQVPKRKRDLRWCRGTLLHPRESSLNFRKEDLGILIVLNSKYPNNQMHCMAAFLTTCD